MVFSVVSSHVGKDLESSLNPFYKDTKSLNSFMKSPPAQCSYLTRHHLQMHHTRDQVATYERRVRTLSARRPPFSNLVASICLYSYLHLQFYTNTYFIGFTTIGIYQKHVIYSQWVRVLPSRVDILKDGHCLWRRDTGLVIIISTAYSTVTSLLNMPNKNIQILRNVFRQIIKQYFVEPKINVFISLGFELRPSCLRGRGSTTRTTPPALSFNIKMVQTDWS